MDDTKLSITEHLSELRGRLIKAALGILATMSVAIVFSPELLDYAVSPLIAVLEEKSRVEAVVVHADPAEGDRIAETLAANPRVRLRERLTSLAPLRELAAKGVGSKNPIDLVLVSATTLGPDGSLAGDVLEGIEPPPYVVYLVKSAHDPLVQDLMLEGANVVLEPPRKVVLSRQVRRAAGAAGKAAATDKLVVLSPLEPFFAYLKIALVIGLFAACPIWLYQLWMFVAPGLYGHEKRLILPVILSGSVLFLGGGLFAYFAMFPLMFDVLVNQMMPASVSSSFTVEKYLSLLMQMTVAFGSVFETPLALAILSMIGIVRPQMLRNFRKYWIVLAFVLGAIFTPADPLSQVMMAVPLLLFYEIGLVASTIITKRREDRLAEGLKTPPPAPP